MRAKLFRKLVIDGVNYYQFYDEVEDFEKNPSFLFFADYSSRMTKDYFYIDANDDIEIENLSPLNVYIDSDDGLKTIDDSEEFMRILKIFKEKFNIRSHDTRSIDEIVDKVNESVLFQQNAVFNLVNQIYLNQIIMTSSLPVELKLKQKSNILFSGPLGSGKKSIIEILENNLDIPYADIIITGELNNSLKDIMDQLLSRSKNDEEASRGIVYVRDNFMGLSQIFKENIHTVPQYFTSQDVILYKGHEIDFRTLTFVMLFDGDSADAIMYMQNITGCDCVVSTEVLSDKQKYLILLSENGRLRHYEKFLNKYGAKLNINETSLRRIIRACSSVDKGMNVLHAVIDGIMKQALLDAIMENDLFGTIADVSIDKACADFFVPMIYEHKKQVTEEINEKIKEEVFDDSLKKVYELVISRVIGQDKQVKNILYTILENRRMANKSELTDPKKYIKNILIRGESGGGKTLIIETISKVLNIPMFIADATQYTEEGYVGSSVSDMLIRLYHMAGDNLEEAEKGILVIDEIDKKTREGNSQDVSRGAVLDGLLKIIEGAIIPINVGNKIQEENIMFDTSRLTVICSGAFEGIEEYRDARLGIKKKAGFISAEEEKSIAKKIADEGRLIDTDYVKYGMKKQFMSRLPVMVELNKNTVESLIDIMKKSSVSALKIEKYILENRGIEIEYTESFYEELAKEALAMKVGARGISKALARVLSSINIEDIEASEVERIIFDGPVVYDPNEIILIPREKSKQKIK